MTSTRPALLALLPALAIGLSACSAPPPPSPQICVGPETPDDLEDLIDRDIVRHPDASCPNPASRLMFVEATLPLPEVGEEIGEEARTRYIALAAPSRSRSSASRSAPATSAPARPRVVTPPRAAAPRQAPAPIVRQAPAPRVSSPKPR